MSNGELALWQTNHQSEPSKTILAQQEWLDRRLARQIRASFFVAFIGLGGTLAGVALGWHLRSIDRECVVQNHSNGEPQREHQQKKPATEKEKPSAISNVEPTNIQSAIPSQRPNEDDTKTKKR